MTTESVPRPPSVPPALPAAGAPESESHDAEMIFHVDQVTTVAGGHFMHDTFSAFLTPLLPALQDKLALNYTMAGSLVVFTWIPSLLNPFLGYLADKISLRYFVIFAPAVTATLMSTIGMAPSYFALALLLLAVGVSIAAFHAPAPAMIARVSGNRVGTGMSIFMATGELGRTVGPIVAVAGVTWWGLDGIWRLAVLGWLTSAVLYWRLHNIAAQPARNSSLADMAPHARRIFPILIWVMLPKVFMAIALTTYLPIFMKDELNASLWLGAAALTILEGAGVVGALMTGTMSDNIGRRRMLLILLSIAPFLLLLFLVSPPWLAVPLLIGLGLTAISPTPVMLAIVQDQFPDNRAVANGIFMFLNFIVRAFGVWMVGVMADRYGLNTAFFWSALIAFLSIPAIFRLPEQARAAH